MRRFGTCGRSRTPKPKTPRSPRQRLIDDGAQRGHAGLPDFPEHGARLVLSSAQEGRCVGTAITTPTSSATTVDDVTGLHDLDGRSGVRQEAEPASVCLGKTDGPLEPPVLAGSSGAGRCCAARLEHLRRPGGQACQQRAGSTTPSGEGSSSPRDRSSAIGVLDASRAATLTCCTLYAQVDLRTATGATSGVRSRLLPSRAPPRQATCLPAGQL